MAAAPLTFTTSVPQGKVSPTRRAMTPESQKRPQPPSEPPRATLPFSSGSHRLELDLGDAGQRKRWQEEFNRPVEHALETLPRRGVRVYSLRGDAPSESWLPLLGRAQSQVA